MNETMVFVYGSLRRGLALHGHLKDARPIGDGVASGFVMFDLGSYPAVEPTPYIAAQIRGEVYAVNPATLARLDRVEGVGHDFYSRGPATVRLDGGDVLMAHLYFMRPGRARKDSRDMVLGGDWVAYLAQRPLATAPGFSFEEDDLTF